MTAPRRLDRAGKQALPLIALVMAFLIAVALPTALRPPPDQANASGAINPDAPPEDNTQFVEAQQEASGGGAGSGLGDGTTTTVPVTVPRIASLNYCYGKPPRQIPSVYSGPCVGAWKGNNGGATYKNVFPNEIRIGIQGAGGPDEGRLGDASKNNAGTTASTRTWQALEEYFNRHFQFYNRKVKFYGLTATDDKSASASEADATKAATEHQVFIMHSTVVAVCQPFIRKGFIAICDPMSRADGAKYTPGLFSKFMDHDQALAIGAEFACKTLVGKAARFGGADVNGKPRKFGYIGYKSPKGGIDGSAFAAAFKKECGADVEVAMMSGGADAQGSLAATSRFRADGVTTIIMYNQGVNILLAMQQADNLGYQPEWDMIGAFAVDTNLIGTLFPKNQARHLFGTSTSEELPLPLETRECYQAIREIDPSFTPSQSVCLQWWEQLVHQMSGLQGAGPNLNPQTFENAMYALGHQFGQTNYNFGGGYGPDDKGFIDDVAIVWWDSGGRNLDDGTPGAYTWIRDGRRFQRGELPDASNELFKSGITFAPAPVSYR